MRIPILASGDKQLRALGFDFAFDRNRVVFSGWTPGRIIQPWSFNGAQLSGDSTQVRVGGFDIVGSRLSGTDTLAVLYFDVICGQGSTSYLTTGFVDDLQGSVSCEATAPIHCGTAVEALPWSGVKVLFR